MPGKRWRNPGRYVDFALHLTFTQAANVNPNPTVKENEELRDQNAQLREANAEPLARGPGARVSQSVVKSLLQAENYLCQEDMERQLEEVQHDLVESVRRHKMATQASDSLRSSGALLTIDTGE